MIPCFRLSSALLLTAFLTVGCGEQAGGEQSATTTSLSADDPRFVEARNEAFRVFDSGDSQAALVALTQAYQMRPQAYGVSERLGRVFADLKRNPEALEAFERAHGIKPDALDTVLALVTIQTKLGLAERALELLPLLHEDEALLGEALYLEAVVRDQAGERERAVALVSRATELEPATAYRALSLHGRYLLEDGDRAGASEHFRRSVDGRADYKEALKGMADCARLSGDAEAAAHWDEVLDLVLGLTDNEFVRQQATAQNRVVQAQAGERSDYVRRELALRKLRLQRMTEIHPQWVDAFRRLAELQLSDGENAAACATIERFFEQHAELVPEQDVAQLRSRYCGGS